jgi:hypothetical protein
MRRQQITETRCCWECGADFPAKYEDEVYCTPRCGWLAHTGKRLWLRVPAWARSAA